MLLKFNKHQLEMYDSIEELPIKRFQLYNVNAAIDAGIGSDLSATNTHLSNIFRLVTVDPQSAQREVQNLQQNIHFIMKNQSPKLKSFVVLIRSIDGENVTEKQLTETGLQKIIDDLNHKKLSIGKVQQFLNLFKKKIENEFAVFFPSSVAPQTKEHYLKLKQRVLLVLQGIKQGKNFDNEIQVIDRFFLNRLKPANFFGANGLEVQMKRGFEKTAALLQQHGVSNNPYSVTTLAYYEALEVVKEQIKKSKKKR